MTRHPRMMPHATAPASPSPCPSSQASVFVVDDDVSFLRAISRLLRAAGFRVVIHNSAAELLAELRPDTQGCVVSDLMMPDMDGWALQAALRQAGSLLPLVFLTGHGDVATCVHAMRAGAEDFLTKEAPQETWLAAVTRALARNQRERAQQAHLQALHRPFELLTPREREVLRHVVQGQLNKQIAADLGIHERTVKLHRTHITTKLGVRSVAELTRMVQAAGIFPWVAACGDS
jgi:two-component system, LuxR family, response regulator FixJ